MIGCAGIQHVFRAVHIGPDEILPPSPAFQQRAAVDQIVCAFAGLRDLVRAAEIALPKFDILAGKGSQFLLIPAERGHAVSGFLHFFDRMAAQKSVGARDEHCLHPSPPYANGTACPFASCADYRGDDRI